MLSLDSFHSILIFVLIESKPSAYQSKLLINFSNILHFLYTEHTIEKCMGSGDLVNCVGKNEARGCLAR